MPDIPTNVFRYRPMTVGQVADVVGVPRETLRTWLRDEVFDSLRQVRQKGGWRRFTDFEAICIGIYGRVLDCCRDHEAARVGMLLSAQLIMDEWVKVEDLPYLSNSTFERDRFLLFWRSGDGHWTADVCDMGDDFNNAVNARVDETYESGPSFLVVNLGQILKGVLRSLLKVQIAMEGKE